LAHSFTRDCDAFIWLLDANDRERLLPNDNDERTVGEQLAECVAQLPEHIPILIIANKMDLPSALSTSQLCNQLNIRTMMGPRRRWCIMGLTQNHMHTTAAINWILTWIHTVCSMTIARKPATTQAASDDNNSPYLPSIDIPSIMPVIEPVTEPNDTPHT
jgi:GTPase SAR1 family protein